MNRRIFGGRVGIDPVCSDTVIVGLQDIMITSKLRALSDALVAGARAFMDGKKPSDNPYDREKEYSNWSDWRFAYTECQLQENKDASKDMSKLSK